MLAQREGEGGGDYRVRMLVRAGGRVEVQAVPAPGGIREFAGEGRVGEEVRGVEEAVGVALRRGSWSPTRGRRPRAKGERSPGEESVLKARARAREARAVAKNSEQMSSASTVQQQTRQEERKPAREATSR